MKSDRENAAVSLALLGQAVREARVVARPPAPAHLGLRVGAVVVDGIILWLALLFGSLGLQAIVELSGLPRRYVSVSEGTVVSVLAILLLLYSLTEMIGAATPGKWLLRLRVGQGDGRSASPGRRVFRWAVRNLPLLLFCTAAALLVVARSLGVLRFSQPADTIRDIFGLLLGASAITFLLLAAGMLLTLAGESRAMHDWVTGTSVFRTRDMETLPVAAFRPVMQMDRGSSIAPRVLPVPAEGAGERASGV